MSSFSTPSAGTQESHGTNVLTCSRDCASWHSPIQFTPLGGQTYTTTVFTSYIVLSAVLERHVGLPTEFRKPEKNER